MYDLYDCTDQQEVLFWEKVTEYKVYDHNIFLIRKQDTSYIVTIINTQKSTQTDIFTNHHCECLNISASKDIVASDIFGINGSRAFDKLTIFYHISKREYRIMNADFLAQAVRKR